jgi:hypothetical protein
MTIPADNLDLLLREAGGGKQAVFGTAEGYCIMRTARLEANDGHGRIHTSSHVLTVDGARFASLKVNDTGTAGGIPVKFIGHDDDAERDARLARLVVRAI